MNWREKISALLNLPIAYRHIKSVKKQLDQHSYESLLANECPYTIQNLSMPVIIKSYFWASRILGKGLCLPRSISLYQSLTAAGYDVNHKFGVNKNNGKLTAHAWVEYKATPLNESEDLYVRFKVMK